MIKNIIKLILAIAVVIGLYKIYNMIIERFDSTASSYIFEVEKTAPLDIIKTNNDISALIDESKKNYVELPPGVYNSYKLGIAKTFYQMKDSKGLVQIIGDPHKPVIISVTPKNLKKLQYKLMTFSLQSNPKL